MPPLQGIPVRRATSGVSAFHRPGPGFVSVATVLLILVLAGTAGTTPPAATHSAFPSMGAAQSAVGASVSASPRVLANCTVDAAWSDAYDATDGYVYVASAYGGVFVVKPPCTVIKTLLPNVIGYGTAYDPATKEIVVSDSADVVAYVIRGVSVQTKIGLGFDLQHDHCPDFEVWDGAIGSMLIADGCPTDPIPYGGGVDILHLTVTNGVTHASVRLDAFDRNNGPGAVLVADGYVFSAGDVVDVFDAKTLHFVGDFAVNGPGNPVEAPNTLGWDPLTHTVVLGRGDVGGHKTVVFLNASSIRSGKFSFSYLSAPGSRPGLLWGGVGGVAYSPATRNLYLTAYGGNDVWELNQTGALTHVYLGQYAYPQGLTYDPNTQNMYVCGFDTSTVYVIR